VILFFELAVIRWTAANVYYVGYFTNFVLLACMLGIGLGCMGAKWKTDLFRCFPMAVFAYIILIYVFDFNISLDLSDQIHFQEKRASTVPIWMVLPLVFLFVAGILTSLSQPLSQLLQSLPPLRAYTLNILGSLAGIAAYTLSSFARLPAMFWFAASLGIFLLLSRAGKRWKQWQVVCTLGCLAISGADLVGEIYWSPYYKIRLFPYRERGEILGAGITVNGIGHQNMIPPDDMEKFYHAPYWAFADEKPFEDVLMIGAGSGGDIAVGLSHGVKHFDAVEIDPVIAGLGVRRHPAAPYQDPRVDLHINDGRAFLQRTQKKYDMVAFGLPDSLTLASAYSSLRLENYLFTIECFRTVRSRLKKDGVFVLYNYYREEWYIQKLAKMLEEAFNEKPLVIMFKRYENLPGILMVGPKVANIPAVKRPRPFKYDDSLVSATDDWPFTYLRKPTIPKLYFLMFGLLIPLCVGAVYVARPQAVDGKRFYSHFFFMGAGFFLLETKSIVQFSLLFGSTWLVNSLVFFAILLAVLLANAIVSKYRLEKAWPFVVALGLSIALNYFIPMDKLLFENWALRYLVASTLIFSPILFANLLFSRFFRDTEAANLGFASNLLGTLVGGTLEYTSLLFGYRKLMLLVAVIYALAMLTAPWGKAAASAQEDS
jgi:hypothetical protein